MHIHTKFSSVNLMWASRKLSASDGFQLHSTSRLVSVASTKMMNSRVNICAHVYTMMIPHRALHINSSKQVLLVRYVHTWMSCHRQCRRNYAVCKPLLLQSILCFSLVLSAIEIFDSWRALRKCMLFYRAHKLFIGECNDDWNELFSSTSILCYEGHILQCRTKPHSGMWSIS